MAECQLPKLDVASSSLVSRSLVLLSAVLCVCMGIRTQVAKGAVCKTAIRQFDSGRVLLISPLFYLFPKNQ